MKVVIMTLLVAALTFLGVKFFVAKQKVVEEPYTPPASENAPIELKKHLPYSTKNFEISWNETTGKADAIIHPPYPESSQELLNWLADHNANNLPLGTLNIIRK